MFISQDENDENYEEVEGEVADVFDSDFDDDVSISSFINFSDLRQVSIPLTLHYSFVSGTT